MSKPRFESRMQVWLPTSVADAYERLAAGGMLAVSDHMRQALVNYLAQLEAAQQPTQQKNGKEHANGV